MIYSRSVEYAIRALTHLAGETPGGQKMARQIAEQEELPIYFLAKTLQQLARKGLLKSTKGPTGGFGLNRPASRIRLIEVVEALDGPDPFERGPNDAGFQRIRRDIVRYLRKTTIADLARRSQKRRATRKRKRTARKRSHRSGS